MLWRIFSRCGVPQRRTIEPALLPSLAGLTGYVAALHPALKGLGYFRLSLRDINTKRVLRICETDH